MKVRFPQVQTSVSADLSSAALTVTAELSNPTGASVTGVDVSDSEIAQNGNSGIDLGGANNAAVSRRQLRLDSSVRKPTARIWRRSS